METQSTTSDMTETSRDLRARREGPVARTIESQTSKLPSDFFLWAAVGSMIGSAALQFMKQRSMSLFVGQWAPALLILGVYNKIVKVAGSDRTDQLAGAQTMLH